MDEQNKPSEQMPGENTPEKETPRFRGLYRYVHVSVKTLDIIIIVCIAVIILVTALSMKDRGFVVSFDSRGGSDVAAIKYQYGDFVAPAENPVREGYRFTGWYKDPGCQEPWVTDEDTVTGAFTLYAGWEKKT